MRYEKDENLVVEQTLLGVSGILLNLLKNHFTYTNSQFKYSNNPIETKLLIDLHQQWRPENCENHPGIYVKREGTSFRSPVRTMGDYNKLLENKYSYSFIITNTSQYSIMVIGKEFGEVENLAEETAMFLTAFGERIRQDYEFINFEVTQVSATQIYQEDKQFRLCQIGLNLIYNRNWDLTLEQPSLKTVDIRTE